MSGHIVGINPGAVYTEAEALQGKCPAAGTRGFASDNKEYVLCKAAASQNLVRGHVVTIASGFVVTVAAAGPPAASRSDALGVVGASTTLSASSFGWVQIAGATSVLATASTLPGVMLTMSAAAGTVDDAVSSTSGVIHGMTLLATTGASGLTAALLNYPRFNAPSHTLT